MLKYIYLFRFYIIIKFFIKDISDVDYRIFYLISDLQDFGFTKQYLFNLIKDDRKTFYTKNTAIRDKIKGAFLHDREQEPTLSNLIENLYRQIISNVPILSKLSSLYNNIEQGLQNFYIWRKIIWKDRDWDYYYILILLRKKLENVKKFESTCSFACDSNSIVTNIEECLILIERITDDSYSSKLLEKIDEEFGKTIIQYKNVSKVLREVHFVNEDNSELSLERRKKTIESFRNAEIEKQNDINKLFGIISKNIVNWWD